MKRNNKVCLASPAVLTGARCRRLVTQSPAASWRTVTRYPRLSALPAGALSTHAAGVTPCANGIALPTEQEREKRLLSFERFSKDALMLVFAFCHLCLDPLRLRSSRGSETQVLSLAVDPDIVDAAVKSLKGTLWAGSQT